MLSTFKIPVLILSQRPNNTCLSGLYPGAPIANLGQSTLRNSLTTVQPPEGEPHGFLLSQKLVGGFADECSSVAVTFDAHPGTLFVGFTRGLYHHPPGTDSALCTFYELGKGLGVKHKTHTQRVQVIRQEVNAKFYLAFVRLIYLFSQKRRTPSQPGVRLQR